MREEIEVLEHHPDVAALPGRLARMQFVQLAALLLVSDQHAIDIQATCR